MSYLLEHTNLYQVREKGHHELILILPGSVVELQVQHWRESLFLEDCVHQHIAGPAPPVQPVRFWPDQFFASNLIK